MTTLDSGDKVNTLVIHRGSRRRYAVPRLLEKKGLLAGFYTDAHSSSFLGKTCSLIPERYRPASIQRLCKRIIDDVPVKKIKSWDSLVFRDIQLARSSQPLQQWLEAKDSLWLTRLKKQGFSSANVLYSMSAENLSALRYASKQGLTIIVDAFIDPRNCRILREEKLKLGLSLDRFEQEYEVTEQHYAKIYRQSDVILCPSTSVAEGILELSPDVFSQIKIVPYGSSLSFNPRDREPIEGRILWAGSDWIRKGLHYLADAAASLKHRYPKLEVRVAGITDVNVINNPRFENLTFLGRLDKEAFKKELMSAHMFVLPTLVEGMVGVVIEALAAGCPVITTRAAGIDNLNHEESALLIPKQDSQAIAESIERLITDRMLAERLTTNAEKLASTFTEQSWSDRLYACVAQAKINNQSVLTVKEQLKPTFTE